MNIFVLDNDHDACARAHCDKHVVKMIVETAQLLCTAHWETGSTAHYKSTHRNHPCSVWTRASASNYAWLVKLGLALCHEYTRRYGRRHKTQDVIEWADEHVPNIDDIGLTPFVLAMPDEFKGDDPIESYRRYYLGEKSSIAKWRYSDEPRWWREMGGSA